MITRQELGSMTLQRLAYILPQDLEEETMVKEVFDQRASVSTYQTLTTIDVKLGWQEEILQKYVNTKRETMAIENPASLTSEEESFLDASVITKEKELELQEILDKRNSKRKGIQKPEKSESEVEPTLPEDEKILPSEEPALTPELDEVTETEEDVKKVSKKKK